MINPGILNVTDVFDLNARLPIDFPQSVFPVLEREEEWRDWANQVAYNEPFLDRDAPGSDNYATPQDWLVAFLRVLTL